MCVCVCVANEFACVLCGEFDNNSSKSFNTTPKVVRASVSQLSPSDGHGTCFWVYFSTKILEV